MVPKFMEDLETVWFRSQAQMGLFWANKISIILIPWEFTHSLFITKFRPVINIIPSDFSGIDAGGPFLFFFLKRRFKLW